MIKLCRNPKQAKAGKERKTMKVELTSECATLSVSEVVEQLKCCGALNVEPDKKIGECRVECGCDLEIDIMENEPDDPRIDGCLSHTESFTLADIKVWFDQADAYAWAKDEDGDEILLCFAN